MPNGVDILIELRLKRLDVREGLVAPFDVLPNDINSKCLFVVEVRSREPRVYLKFPKRIDGECTFALERELIAPDVVGFRQFRVEIAPGFVGDRAGAESPMSSIHRHGAASEDHKLA